MNQISSLDYSILATYNSTLYEKPKPCGVNNIEEQKKQDELKNQQQEHRKVEEVTNKNNNVSLTPSDDTRLSLMIHQLKNSQND